MRPTEFDVLIVRQDQHYIRLSFPGLLVREIGWVQLRIVIVVPIVVVVIRLVKGATTLTTVNVVDRGVGVRPPGIDTQQYHRQKLQ